MFPMSQPNRAGESGQIAHPFPRKYLVAMGIGAGILLGWIFSGYFSPQILIDFVLRYCA